MKQVIFIEKDYFLDRHPQYQEHSKINIGDEVYICLKKAQPYAKVLDDLTRITVEKHLTSQKFHPRGQKVEGYELIYNPETGEHDRIDRVGRVVYIIENSNKVLTTEGYKYIEEYNKENIISYRLVTEKYIKDRFSLYLVFSFNNFTFEVPLNKYWYFKEEEIQPFVNSFKCKNGILGMDYIFYIANTKKVFSKDVSTFFNNNKEDLNDVFNFISNNFESLNKAKDIYNQVFFINYIGITAYPVL